MNNNKSSETAFATVTIRALSTYEEHSEIRTDDFIAEKFIPDDKIIFLNSMESRESIKKMFPQGLYEYVIARTKFFDKIYKESNNVFKQIVLIGAGYDSRPYRINSLSNIYEMDLKSTQENKLSLLTKSNISVPNNVKYIPLDLESDNFIQLLKNNGYNNSLKTLFLMEGVSFYLSKKTINKILKLIKDNATKESRFCFDFQTISNNSDLINTGVEDENVRFGIKDNEINSLQIDFGFKIIEHLKSNDMENLFLKLNNGQIYGKIAPIMNFIILEVI